MNKMFKNPNQKQIKTDDITSRGLIDWDRKVEFAIANNNSWKYSLWLALGTLAVSVSGNVWQARQSNTQVVHVLHDSTGSVTSVAVSSDGSGEPTQAMLQADVQDWIKNVRTVYVDTNALKTGILSAYNRVKPGSQAQTDLNKFYTTQDRFELAKDETVSLQDVVAVPPTAATIGPDKMQTWAVTWTEHVEGRDGQYAEDTRWAANVTFTITVYDRNSKPEDVRKSPDGISIIAYSWTKK